MKLSYVSRVVRFIRARWFFLLDMPEGNSLEEKGAAGLKGNVVVKRGTGNTVTVGRGTRFDGSIEIQGARNTVVIGDHSTSNSVYILCQEGASVRIGRWCMLSRDIEIRTTDAHSVIDRQTGKRLSTPASIIIGDHVWVGVGAVINKGASIAADGIVGVPARIAKRGVTWNRSRKNVLFS